jgi:hypothetical protein
LPTALAVRTKIGAWEGISIAVVNTPRRATRCIHQDVMGSLVTAIGAKGDCSAGNCSSKFVKRHHRVAGLVRAIIRGECALKLFVLLFA